VLTNVKSPVYNISILTSRISDHFPLIFSLPSNLGKKTPTQKTITKRIFSSSNDEKFKNALNAVNWGVVREAENVQESFNIFADIFNNFYSLHYPLKTFKFNKNIDKIKNMGSH